MLDEDRIPLTRILSRLGLHIETLDAFKLMPENVILDLKIQTWAIKELYLSPHRVLLNDLTSKKFMLKYQKARKYITEEKGLKDLINYFMVCLHEELEEGRYKPC